MNQLKNTNEYTIKKSPYFLSHCNKIKVFNRLSNNNYNDINNDHYNSNMPYDYNYPMNTNYIDSNKNNDIREPLINTSQINNNKNIRKNILYNNMEEKAHEIGNNRQIIIDNGYMPYTLKDYKKINNAITLGRLGENIETEQWNKRKERMKKMSEYGKQLVTKIKERNIKTNESKNEDEKMNKRKEYLRNFSDNKN